MNEKSEARHAWENSRTILHTKRGIIFPILTWENIFSKTSEMMYESFYKLTKYLLEVLYKNVR